jgi:4-hydroxy-2-oxoheptanedioate aldolase
VLAAERFHVTPWLRLSSYPWGDADVDPGLPAQVLRGLSIGAECVIASVNTAKQVEAMLHPLSNPHRRLYVRHDADPRTAAQREYDDAQSPQWVVPIIESGPALDNLDQLLAVDGLKMIYLGMGDLTKALGKSDEHDPEVRKAVADVVGRAKKQDIRVAVNTLGYGPDADFSEQVAMGVKALGELGVDAAMTPRPTLALQRYYESLLRTVRPE